MLFRSEQNNKPIGEDIKYRGGKQLRLICNGCDTFCVTVRMKRFRVAGEESVSKFFVIKEKSCLDHINCDPTKIKYDIVPPTEEGAGVGGAGAGGAALQNPKRRISTSTHRTSFLGSKKEEAALHGTSLIPGQNRKSGGSGSSHVLVKDLDDSDNSSDSDSEADDESRAHKRGGAGSSASSSSGKNNNNGNNASYVKVPYDATLFDLQGDPLAGLTNQFWATRSEAKAELEVSLVF